MEAPAAQDHGTGAVARRAGIVVGGTLASRLLGAVRDGVIAATFPYAMTDTFFVAWTIPNTLRGLLAEGAVSAAFIPVFSQQRETAGHAAARDYFGRFLGTMLALLLAVACLGIASAPVWAGLYGAGYKSDPERFAMLVDLTRLLFPYIVFAGVAAIGMGALNALGYFAVPAFAPALLNLSLIAAPLVWLPLSTTLGVSAIKALAWAALLGGVLQVWAQLPALRRAGLGAWPRFAPRDPAVRRSLGLMLPLLVGSGIHQVDVLLARLLASFLPEGSQSFLYYSQRVVEIPQGMFAIAIASAALPSLAALHQRGDDAGAQSTLRFSLRLTLFISIPSAVAIGVLAEPIVAIVFGRGAFGPYAIEQTAAALAVMAASVCGVAAIHPVVRMFHAYGDTRSPVLCSAVNLVAFVTVSLATMRVLQHVAIAAASAVATLLQLSVLLVLLRRKLGPLQLSEVLYSAVRHLAAATVMAGAVIALSQLGDWPAGGNHPRNLVVFCGCLLTGIAVYTGVAYLLRCPEVHELLRSLRRRRRS